MGIRTIGFEKASRTSPPVDEDRSRKVKKEEGTIPVSLKSGGSSLKCEPVVKSEPPDVEEEEEEAASRSQESNKTVTESSSKLVTTTTPEKSKASLQSPVKPRTPTSMARLSGMRTTRKLKKHRKRSLYVHSANKILRSSIRSTKTRQITRQQEEKEKPRENGSPPQPRISTRMLIRRSSREGIPEDPLRTVELIKRPLELREPATKLLYMASLGLYPNTGDSDMTPIVVVKEVCSSPGKKNGVRKSLELPLIPYHKRVMDLSNQEKRNSPETVKTTTAPKLTNKRESRKTPPSSIEIKSENVDTRKTKVSEKRQTQPQKKSSPSPRSDARANSMIISSSQAITAVSSISITEVSKKKVSQTPPPVFEPMNVNNLTSTMASNSAVRPHSDLIITPSSVGVGKLSPSTTFTVTSSNQGISNLSVNSKSILKTNLSPPSLKAASGTSILQQTLFPSALNLTTSNPPVKVELSQPLSTNSLLASNCSVTNAAMNLLMSNITILPTSLPSVARKRSASPPQSDQNTMTIRPVGDNIITCGNGVTISIPPPPPSLDRKPPPKKKQKLSNNDTRNTSRPSLSPITSVPLVNSISQNAPYPQMSTDGEALNLCVKRSYEPPPPPIPALSQSPPKLQYKSEVRHSVNGSKPLNLIIPRPPPLTKAPLEITNIANCTQNIMPPVIGYNKGNLQSQSNKKPRKLRQQNHNHVNPPNHHLLLPQSLPHPLPLSLSADTSLHAKSLLKCMNGEENAGVGETLDSVKTMLARLQTSIGPAVNGVRLITIE